MPAQADRLRALLAGGDMVVAPGASTALLARVVQDEGFPVVYATGAGMANMIFGYPDMGLVTMSEILENTRRIVDAVDIPVIADIDTGYGNALNVTRTVREFVRAGAACLQMEDQAMPKRCGHFKGKALISCGEMCQKVRAAKDSMGGGALLIARTDAIAVEGFERALERAHAYEQAGADLLFVEAPRTREQMQRVASEFGAPAVANMVEGGLTPLLGVQELQALGYRLALYANAPLKAAICGTQNFLRRLRDTGTSDCCGDIMITMDERKRLTDTAAYDDLQARYAER